MIFRINNLALNILLVGLLLLLYASGTQSFRFERLEGLETSFPGSSVDWAISGASVNTAIGDDSISVSPKVAKLALMSKAYDLVPTSLQTQFVQIEGTLEEITPYESNTSNWEGQQQPSLFYFWFENAENEKSAVKHIRLLDGASRVGRHKVTALIPENATSVHVALLLRNPTAGYRLHSMTVEKLANTAEYNLVIAVLIALCVFTCFICIFTIVRGIGFGGVATLALSLCLLAFGASASGNEFGSFVRFVFSILDIAPLQIMASNSANLQNIAHVVGYVFLSIVVLEICYRLRHSLLDTFFKLFVLTFVTEAIQMHRLDRNSNMYDVVFNVLGVIIGFFVWYLCRKFCTRRRTSKLGEHI